MKKTMDKLPNYISYSINLVLINAVSTATAFKQFNVVHQALSKLFNFAHDEAVLSLFSCDCRVYTNF